MGRDRLRKLVLGGAVASLGAWVVLPRIGPALGPTPAQAAPAEVDAAGPAAAAPAPDDARPEYAADLHQWVAAPWPDDPFRLTPTEVAEGEKTTADAQPTAAYRPVLSAILSGAASQALIDGQVFKVGDRLADGSVIAAIEDLRVTLQGPQGPWMLELPE